MNLYLFAKSLHVIGFVSWFAGLFYLVRLFVYHAEVDEKKTKAEAVILKPQYELMEHRLYTIITNPAMVITWLGGLTMITLGYIDDSVVNWMKTGQWLHVKLLLVIMLSGYTGYCKKIMRELKAGKLPMSSDRFRLFNELPTLFLAAIVLLAVYKNFLHFGIALAGLVAFGVALGIGVKVYKKAREKAGN
jgi:protoporphyrinogen IX oxidase